LQALLDLLGCDAEDADRVPVDLAQKVGLHVGQSSVRFDVGGEDDKLGVLETRLYGRERGVEVPAAEGHRFIAHGVHRLDEQSSLVWIGRRRPIVSVKEAFAAVQDQDSALRLRAQFLDRGSPPGHSPFGDPSTARGDLAIDLPGVQDHQVERFSSRPPRDATRAEQERAQEQAQCAQTSSYRSHL